MSVRIDAQRRIYGIAPQGFAELDHWLVQMKRFWGARLDLLERELKGAKR